ncbi:MAG: hypothetical protein LBP23_09675 [Treponema sp.]|jgi:hypothetical protein|nr:hypothetical protein [Treponema sp.]
MKARSLPGFRAAFAAALATAALTAAALCCAGCIQEIDLSDKYINEAVGLLRVENTSAGDSYYFKGFELKNEAGGVVRAWEGLALGKGETWTGDVDREGLYTLYCTVRDDAEEAEELYEYGEVEIKLHQVTGLGIAGEACLTASDRDGDGFSDTWETRNGFNPDDPADGDAVYVSSTAQDDGGRGTAASPYKTLAKGVWKARSGLSEAARTVMVVGELNRDYGNVGSDTSVFYIADTGPRGVTISGHGSTSALDAQSKNSDWKRVLYLGPGTKLTLENITIKNGYAFWGAGVHVNGAELTLGPGTKIQHCTSSGGMLSGAAIYASNGAAIVMENGSLIGGGNDSERNTAINGEAGAVGLDIGSSLTMKNGSLIQGNFTNWGGAVSADLGSLVTLEQGALITGNNSNQDGGKSGNINHGGGVRLTGKSKLLMTGGSITLNTVKTGGGGAGVYVGPESVLDLRSGEISGNKTETTTTNGVTYIGDGGGVYVDSGGIFLMSGGVVAKNTAKGKGGGVYVSGGSFAMTGGTVYGSGDSNENKAETGNAKKGHALFVASPDNAVDGTLSGSFTL